MLFASKPDKQLNDWTQMQIKARAFVALAYELTLKTGEVVDSSTADDPLTFVFGVGQIIPGLETALEGLSKGDSKKATVAPEEAYGRHDAALIQRIPKASFPEDAPLEPGIVMTAETPHGSTNFTIISISGDEIEVDFNHPLAGKELTFDVTVVEVRELTKEESEVIEAYERQMAEGHDCSCCSSHGSCGDGESKSCSDE